jgi:hypothetical protein
METSKKSAFAGLALATVVGGGAIAANGATAPPSPDSSQSSTAQARDESKGGHQANGITESLLTGGTATKVRDAALAANPGATIQRVETDAEGAAYEAHLVKSDGTRATVHFDENFNITSTETGGQGLAHGR